MKSFVVKELEIWGERLYNNELNGNDYAKNNYGVVEAYTDASFRKTNYGTTTAIESLYHALIESCQTSSYQTWHYRRK